MSAVPSALESFISEHKPYVIALNTERSLDDTLIDLRVACHTKRFKRFFCLQPLPPGNVAARSVSEAVGGQLDNAKFPIMALPSRPMNSAFIQLGRYCPTP